MPGTGPFDGLTLAPGDRGGGPDILPRSVAVVGNAPEFAGGGSAIDAADWVVRFNNCAGFGGSAGSRTTHLVLVNFGGQAGEWAADPAFAARPVVQAAGEFILPVHPGDAALRHPAPPAEKHGSPGAHDWTPELTDRLRPLGRPVRLLPEGWEERCGRNLPGRGTRRAAGNAFPTPSSGFLIVRRLVEAFAPRGVRVDCHGFGFAGWDGHAWDAERLWFEREADAGRVQLHGHPRRTRETVPAPFGVGDARNETPVLASA